MEKTNRPAILSSAYLPNIQYVSKFFLHKEVIIDIHETYLKQSFRNRCIILSANGVLPLSIPVIKTNGNRTLTKDIQVDNSTNWAHVHWGAIVSSYGKSPFFEIFEDEFSHLFEKNYKFLIDFNIAALTQVFKSLGVEYKFKFSAEYQELNPNTFDYRNSIHPKPQQQKSDPFFNPFPYFQVFAEKYGFQPNLSFIDVVFNEGPDAILLCKKSTSNAHKKVSA